MKIFFSMPSFSFFEYNERREHLDALNCAWLLCGFIRMRNAKATSFQRLPKVSFFFFFVIFHLFLLFIVLGNTLNIYQNW